jgi:hypothetical protein
MRDDALTIAREGREATQLHEIQMAARQRFNEWADATIKYVVAGNAGGIIAVLSFVGTAKPPGGVPSLAFWSAVSFAAGLIAAGGALIGYWFTSADGLPPHVDRGLTKAMPPRLGDWLTRHTSVIALGSFVALVFGIGLGVASLPMIQFSQQRQSIGEILMFESGLTQGQQQL